MAVTADIGAGEARRRALLAAATDIFLERGFAATSIDAIIERAGGSKRNIYSQFGGKEGLFTAIVSQAADQAIAALAIEVGVDRDLRATLAAFGRQLMDIYMSPTLLGVYRMVVAEAQRQPDLARAFYDKGPGRAAARLAEVLELAGNAGRTVGGDPLQHAKHFIGMIRDNLHLEVVLGLRPPPDVDEIDATVEAAVNLFLLGLQPR